MRAFGNESKGALRERIRAGRRSRAQTGHAAGRSRRGIQGARTDAEDARSRSDPAESLSDGAAAAVLRFQPAAVVGYAALPGEPRLDDVLEDLAGIRHEPSSAADVAAAEHGDRAHAGIAHRVHTPAPVPVLLPSTHRGEPLYLGALTVAIDALPARIWGIREPEGAVPALAALAQVAQEGGEAPEHAAPVLVFVPGLAYDSRGVRLGNGGGFYDRTFGPSGIIAQGVRSGDPEAASIVPRLRFIGVCWEDERMETLPHEDWDLVVEAVLTETGLHASRPPTRPRA